MSVFASGLLAAATFWRALLTVALFGIASSTIYLVLVLVAARRYRRIAAKAAAAAASVPESSLPPVTLLKPVHGLEPRLAQNVESFFRQHYPDFEVIFGARTADNAALRVVEEVRARYANVKCRLVLSGDPTWPNAKVFSLEKMIAQSSNQYFVITDSDVEVAPEFLRNIIPPLLDPKVGLVTCLYRGVPAASLWSTLEALGMSVEMPSGVVVADLMEGMRFALGAVIATRRDALESIGGMPAAANYYSDDFVLGNLVWAAGYKVVLSHHIVDHVLIPQGLWRTLGHQLRWTKSTRYSRPKGHLGTGLTFAMPFGLLGLISAAALGRTRFGLAIFCVALVSRVIQSLAVGWNMLRDPRSRSFAWLYPLRDLAGFFTWAGSYTSRRFHWRGEVYRFGHGGRITPLRRPGPTVAEPEL